MREQIKFMSEKLEKAQSELDAKVMLVQQIELEKREAYRKHELLEVQNFELQEKLTKAEVEVETSRKEAQEHVQSILNRSISGLLNGDSSRQMLEEEDGIKLLGASEMLEMAGSGDLRSSLGPSNPEVQANLREQL